MPSVAHPVVGSSLAFTAASAAGDVSACVRSRSVYWMMYSPADEMNE